MDKNAIIGFVLMGVVLIGFTFLNKPSEEELAKQREQARRDSIAYVAKMELENNPEKVKNSDKDKVDDFFAVKQDTIEATSVDSMLLSVGEEKVYSLENDKLKIEISSMGAQVVSAQLKGYKRFDGDSLYLFKNDASMSVLLTNKKGRKLPTKKLNFTTVHADDKSVIMRYAYAEGQHIDFIYGLGDDYFLKYDVKVVGMQAVLDRDAHDILELEWEQKMRSLEKSTKNEQQYSGIRYKYVSGDIEEMSEQKNDEVEVKEPSKWVAFKNQFFSSILVADKKIETVLLTSHVFENPKDYLKTYSAKAFIPGVLDHDKDEMKAGMSFYYGPLGHDHLASYDDNRASDDQLDFDQLVPLGWSLFRAINKYFVIPVFGFLTSTGMSLGLAIFLLTLLVKLLISPLLYKSLISAAKMRVLKPQVEAINAKFPKTEQAAEKQQATMALYNKAGVNPMSGCIPMLLQMPVLFALFRFFPNAIELRQKSFLWADDLSTYDAIIHFPFHIPLLGDHLSLFCILMTITNVIYAKFNMDATNTGQQQMPGMKWMMYLMPIMFLFILNDFPSGLTYYYFISLLMTIVLTLIFRHFVIDEAKVLAKLEANKAKPKKKSGFMARLEEAQRMQQQQQMKQKKGKKK